MACCERSWRATHTCIWPAEGLSSTGAPGQPVPHHPLTCHGRTPPNLIQSALPVPACRLFQLVAGLPSLASWGWVRVFLAAAAATSYAAGLSILSTSEEPQYTTAAAFEHAGRHVRAYAREPYDPSSILGRADPIKLFSLIADRLLAATTQVRRPAHSAIARADACSRARHPYRAMLLSTHCDFALDVVARRPRLIRSNLVYVILAASSLSP